MAEEQDSIGIIGAGTMGQSIARLAASQNQRVLLYDSYPDQIGNAKHALRKNLQQAVEAGSWGQQEVNRLMQRIRFSEDLVGFGECKFVFEAVTDDLEIKRDVLQRAESIIPRNGLLATTTSTLSITKLSASLKRPGRFLGIHFLQPAHTVSLVEIISGLLTDDQTTKEAIDLLGKWDLHTIRPKDTPGFLMNRILLPYFLEPLQMLEEQAASAATIDWAMKTIGGFPSGPFERMDRLGIDYCHRVSKSIYEGLYHDARFTPSITLQRMVEAGLLGKKSGKGFYQYNGQPKPEPQKEDAMGQAIVDRIITTLANGAADALYKKIGTAEEIERAATQGTGFPKGLLSWGEEIGLKEIVDRLIQLQDRFHAERYRPSPLLRQLVEQDLSSFSDGIKSEKALDS